MRRRVGRGGRLQQAEVGRPQHQIIAEIEAGVESYLAINEATVADSLMATSRVYTLFQNISQILL